MFQRRSAIAQSRPGRRAAYGGRRPAKTAATCSLAPACMSMIDSSEKNAACGVTMTRSSRSNGESAAQRLIVKDIQPGPSHDAGLEGLQERSLVEDGSA